MTLSQYEDAYKNVVFKLLPSVCI